MASRTALAICTALIVAFATCSYLAVLRNSPTIDEPICALSGYKNIVDGDLRFDVDNPPLWKYWAALPNLRAPLHPATNPTSGPSDEDGFAVSTRLLFQTPGNDGIAFVNRSRAMLLLLGIALAIVITIWTGRIAGATAAVVACALFCLDPNFIAHSPLVKADVTIALLLMLVACSTWSVGRQASLVNVLGLGVLCGACAVVKYNGLPLAVMSVLLLLGRALAPVPWLVLRKELHTRLARIAVAAAAIVTLMVISWAVIWATYQFRFSPTRSDESLDLASQVETLKSAHAKMRHGEITPTADQTRDSPTPVVAATALFLERYRILPQAWLYGLVSIYRSSTTIYRQSFLMGEVSFTGWWYYFPLAIAIKTPLATLAAIVCACAALSLSSVRRVAPFGRMDLWTFCCIAAPTLMYAVASMLSNTNGGIRYVLPLYPPMYLCIGVAAAKLKNARPGFFRVAAIAIGVGLFAETAAAFPNYISFFNIVARPQRLFLLSDSNFDWGQDLIAVAKWRRENPAVPLYLGYWGPVDPAYYGIEHSVLPGGFTMGPHRDDLFPPRGRSAIIIGATLLQGSNSDTKTREFYWFFLEHPPKQIIGDTMYLYDWPMQ